MRSVRIPIFLRLLSAFIAIVAVCLAAVTWLAVRATLREKELSIYESNSQVASNLAIETGLVFREAERKAIIFSEIQLDQTLSAAARRQILTRIFTQYGDFVRIDVHRKGYDVLRVHNIAAVQRTGHATTDAYDEARDALAVDLERVRAGERLLANTTLDEKLPVITIAFPLGDEVETVVVADLSPTALFRLFEQDAQVHGALLNDRGILLYDSAIERVLAREDLSQLGIVARALAAADASGAIRSQTAEFVDASGTSQLGAYSPVSWGSAIILTQTPRSEAFEGARRLATRSLVVAIAVLLVAIGLSIIVASTFTRPLAELSEATRRIALGEFDIEIEASRSDELGELAQAFNNMARELEDRERKVEQARMQLVQSEKLAAFGQMGAGITHELRNPLSGAKGLVQLARAKPNSEKVGRWLEQTEEALGRALETLQNLLALARPASEEFGPTDVHEVIEQTVSLLSHQMSVHDVKVTTELGAATHHVHGNNKLIQQVFLNLMVNAQQALKEVDERRLTIRSAAHKHNGRAVLQIEVQDSGPGIPPDDLDRVFEPFYSSKAEGEGTGLGLAVSYGIIERHGGELRARLPEEGGTTFVVTLPLQ